MEKDKDGIPVFMNLAYSCFKQWHLENMLNDKRYGGLDNLPDDTLEILHHELCKKQWLKLYQYAKDYNVE